MPANGGWDLTLILLTWTIWRALTNASKWRMGFNSAFKGLTAKGQILVCAIVEFSGRYCQRVPVCPLAVTGIRIVDNMAFRSTQYKRIVSYVQPNRILVLFKVDVLLIRGVAINTCVIQFVAVILKYGNFKSSRIYPVSAGKWLQKVRIIIFPQSSGYSSPKK